LSNVSLAYLSTCQIYHYRAKILQKSIGAAKVKYPAMSKSWDWGVGAANMSNT